MTTPLSYMKDHIQVLQSELDKANARIAQLVDALQQLYDYQNGCPLPTYNTDRTNAMTKANLALTNSSDTWLSEHDKAVEVKVLEEAAEVFETVGYSKFKTPAEELRKMIELRK